MRMPDSELGNVEEWLEILEETERFLLEEVSGGGELRLVDLGQLVANLARTRDMLVSQRAVVERIKSLSVLDKTEPGRGTML